jgi:hypothetical protein
MSIMARVLSFIRLPPVSLSNTAIFHFAHNPVNLNVLTLGGKVSSSTTLNGVPGGFFGIKETRNKLLAIA